MNIPIKEVFFVEHHLAHASTAYYLSPWESHENIQFGKVYPNNIGKVDSFNWTGGVSWFWWYMYDKHLNNKFKFTHDHFGSYWHKKYDFLYLNKQPREHRVNLYKKLLEKIQNKYKTLDIGSYPFFRLGKIGVSLVIRSTEKNQVDDCYEQIINFLKESNWIESRYGISNTCGRLPKSLRIRFFSL